MGKIVPYCVNAYLMLLKVSLRQNTCRQRTLKEAEKHDITKELEGPGYYIKFYIEIH